MAIRLRTINGRLVALCAARSIEKPDDMYLDPEAAVLRAAEESNNQNRAWWDRTYGPALDAAPEAKAD